MLYMPPLYSFSCPLLLTLLEEGSDSFGEHRSLSSYLNAGLFVAVARVGLEARYNPLVMLIHY